MQVTHLGHPPFAAAHRLFASKGSQQAAAMSRHGSIAPGPSQSAVYTQFSRRERGDLPGVADARVDAGDHRLGSLELARVERARRQRKVDEDAPHVLVQHQQRDADARCQDGGLNAARAAGVCALAKGTKGKAADSALLQGEPRASTEKLGETRRQRSGTGRSFGVVACPPLLAHRRSITRAIIHLAPKRLAAAVRTSASCSKRRPHRAHAQALPAGPPPQPVQQGHSIAKYSIRGHRSDRMLYEKFAKAGIKTVTPSTLRPLSALSLVTSPATL
eukprot:3191640-Pleurochrysis_carterae.AAC.1